MKALIERPDQLAELRDAVVAGDADLVASAVEEILRWGSVTMHFRRTATADTELGGRTIRAGDKVVIWFVSADYDDDVFADPFTFDIRRSPNPQVAFGLMSPHLCLGAQLARMEIKVLFEELLPRLADIRIDGADRPPAQQLHRRHQAPPGDRLAWPDRRGRRPRRAAAPSLPVLRPRRGTRERSPREGRSDPYDLGGVSSRAVRRHRSTWPGVDAMCATPVPIDPLVVWGRHDGDHRLAARRDPRTGSWSAYLDPRPAAGATPTRSGA